ncbi:unnamed protein product, partial [Mesorhabditis belari]|uniref:Uncharacterized protein n=1 Tax=Mesorhabditis belari TaxID=2138241 RepID=A0AAF3J2P8_9BILA
MFKLIAVLLAASLLLLSFTTALPVDGLPAGKAQYGGGSACNPNPCPTAYCTTQCKSSYGVDYCIPVCQGPCHGYGC